MAVGSPLRLAFVYPQLKRLTGAQRLILMLASTLVVGGDRVTLVTHQLAAACRTVLHEHVEVVETGARVDWTGRHLVNSALEYAQGARLVERLPQAPDAVVFFGPPSLPALAVARRRGHWPLVSFCYEPPRFAHADLELIAGRFGPAAPAARAAFRLYRPVDRWLLRQADLVCANGRFGAGEVRRVYGRPALVVEHGVGFPRSTTRPCAPSASGTASATARRCSRSTICIRGSGSTSFWRRWRPCAADVPTCLALWPATGLIGHDFTGSRPSWASLTPCDGPVSSRTTNWPRSTERATVYVHTGQREILRPVGAGGRRRRVAGRRRRRGRSARYPRQRPAWPALPGRPGGAGRGGPAPCSPTRPRRLIWAATPPRPSSNASAGNGAPGRSPTRFASCAAVCLKRPSSPQSMAQIDQFAASRMVYFPESNGRARGGMATADRVVTGGQREEDAVLDVSLRPKRLVDYIGQERVKENLRS